MKPEIMESVSTRRQRIVLAAQRNRHEPLTALNHHMDLNWMGEAYRSVRGNAAPGNRWPDRRAVWGESRGEPAGFAGAGEKREYSAPAVKRAYVPKNEKEDRPIGIPTTEDKILQRAVAMILEPIYEQEFLPFSFGFRRGRSQHDALDYLREQCFATNVQWVWRWIWRSSLTRSIIGRCGNF
jgi:RNA-directed DNA polymerase